MAEIISVDHERGQVTVEVNGRELVVQEDEGMFRIISPSADSGISAANIVLAGQMAANALVEPHPEQFVLF